MDFVNKHRRIFFLGTVLAVIFLVITVLSARNGGTEITLTQFITRDRNEEGAANTSNVFTQIPTTPTGTAPVVTPPQPSTPPTYPDIQIQFLVGVGFTPSSKNVRVGQKVIWQNGTDTDIQIAELFPKTSALANGVTVAPGQTTEITLTAAQKGLFTYRELISQTTARLFVTE